MNRTLFVSALFALALTACGKKEAPPPAAPTPPPAAATPAPADAMKPADTPTASAPVTVPAPAEKK